MGAEAERIFRNRKNNPEGAGVVRCGRSESIKVFIGYDSKEPVAFSVLASSILRRASIPVEIVPLTLQSVQNVYTRVRGPLESTEFSMTRFLVPYLSGYQGFSIFMDCDMLCLTDIAEFLPYTTPDYRKAVHCCQHDYTPTEGVKFLNHVQTVYPRKNWSSMMIFNNARCLALTPEYVNTATGLQLHRFQWTTDEKIGSLPLEWNWLIGEYAPNPEAKILHYTLGTPCFEQYKNCDQADLWHKEFASMVSPNVFSTP